jgi:hypothetical protein
MPPARPRSQPDPGSPAHQRGGAYVAVASRGRADRSDDSQIKNGQLTDEDAWAVQRDAMELARRDFINAARRDPVGEREHVSDVPVARPPLAEIRQMFGSAGESDSNGAANLHGGDDG